MAVIKKRNVKTEQLLFANTNQRKKGFENIDIDILLFQVKVDIQVTGSRAGVAFNLGSGDILQSADIVWIEWVLLH